MRWTKVLTVGAVASLGLVAACGSPSTNGTSTGNASGDTGKVEGAAAALDPTAKGPAPAVPGAKKGGILTVSYSSTPANMDPSDQFFQDTAVIFSLSHRALTTFVSRDGKQVLVPDLATDLGKASDDGLTWTFTLKDGIKYEDGTPVKAQDIVWAAKRSFDPDLAANGPSYQRAPTRVTRTGTASRPRTTRRSSSTSRSASRRCLTSSRSTSSRRSPRPRTRRPTTSCTRWPPARTCSTSTPRAPS
jgi:peptide/nickel transport system substrate-binding protein